MFNYNEIISNFPGTPRESQQNVIQNICNIFNNKKKFAIAEVPTGVGKSHIAATLCRSMNNINPEYAHLMASGDAFRKNHDGTYLHENTIRAFKPFGGITLTTTKSLQNQYDDLFEDGEVLKGKNNYQCNVDPNFTVELAPCLLSPKLKEKCLCDKTCSYYNRRSDALSSKFTILNYNVFLNLPDFLRRRQILICDEATEIEEIIISKFSADVSYSFLESEDIPYKKLISDKPDIAFRWLNELYLTVTKITDNLLEIVNIKNKKMTQGIQRDIKRLSKISSFRESIGSTISSWGMCEYVIEKKAHNALFTPYNVDTLTKEIFDSADHVVLMSAYIPKKIVEFLGIKSKDAEHFEIASPFESKKSPIYCSSKYALSYNTMEKFLPKVIDQAITICNGYDKEKGIIHTHSMQITEAFQAKAKSSSRYLFREHGKTNEDIIALHHERADDPTIVVSPSIAFGVSFDDDMGRFQIIIKAPYMPLSSKRIKLLFERDPSYYQTKMLIGLIQMCGRCTRNSKDFSATFILDATICKVLHKEVDKLPKYFLERLV